MEKEKKLRKREFAQYLLGYLLILTAGATLWANVLGNIGFKAAIVLVIILLLMKKYKIALPISLTIFYATTVIMLLILTEYMDGGILAGNDFNGIISTLIYSLLGYELYIIDKKSASRVFVRIVSFFAAISIFFFAIQVTLGAGAFPEFLFRNVHNRSEYGFILYTICKSNQRNYGIFYEPGVYQTVLSSAIFLLLFDKTLFATKKKKILYVLILIIAMLTTGSTTGYISLTILLAFYVLSTNGSKKRKLFMMLIIIATVIIIEYLINRETSLLYIVVLRKFLEIQFGEGYYSYGTSGGARVFVIDIALQVLEKAPLTGIGSKAYYSNYLDGTVWEDSGTGNIFCITIAKRGIVFTTLVISYFIYKAFKNRSSVYSFCAFVLVFFNTIFAQSQLVYGVLAFVSFVHCKPYYRTKRLNVSTFKYNTFKNVAEVFEKRPRYRLVK